ncbi:AarF/UbiB family protein [Pseudonocardia sp. NPDC049635]|uniref:ABC1 kinase family protein n=1 Tax=Pseudonocardia sp. NPDC049635 TaxID=3155506 RepID=UPI00340C5C5C
MESLLTALSALLGVWVLGILVSRPLRMDFSLTRRLAAGAVAFTSAIPIVEQITPAGVVGTTEPFPVLWYLVLGTLLAVLLAMVLLVLAEVMVPSGSLPGPLALLRSLPRRWRRARRYAAIVRVLARHGLAAYVFTRQRPDLDAPGGRARLARSVRAALEDAGVAFVKLGQILATRPDLLPAEFVTELAHLQARARPVPWPEIEAVLAAEWGSAPGVVRVEPEPLAAASIAQVHTGTLADGTEVVVKVQRPGIAAVVADDLDILDRLARRLQRRTRWGARLGVVALADGFAASLREELDFTVELRNVRVMASAAAARGADRVVRTPVPYPEHSTPRVLVLERVHGRPVSTAPGDEELAGALFEALLGQIVLDGVFHADPHPGNILRTTAGSATGGAPLVLLDLGSVGRLDAGLRSGLVRLLLAVDTGDPVPVCDALLELAQAPPTLDERALVRDVGRFLVRATAPGVPADAAVFADLVRIVAAHGIAVPPELAAVFRAIGTLDGTLTALDPGFDLIAAARRFAAEQVRAELEPDALLRRAGTELTTLLPLLRALPRRVDRVLGALDDGTLAVQVRPQAGRLARPEAEAMGQLVATALAATTGFMAVVLLAAPGGAEVGPGLSVHELLGYLLLMVSAILGLRSLARSYRS